VTLVGIDDTDSRERGMCTSYAAHRIAERIACAGGAVDRVVLVRLNPAVEHKTRGNAALAVHADVGVETALSAAVAVVTEGARVGDPNTHPGVVAAPDDPADVPDAVADFAREAVRDHHAIDDAAAIAGRAGYETETWGNGRGRIGALAAVGAWRAFGGRGGDWTYEQIVYRERARRGTPRDVDVDSVFAAADRHYPHAWDTVDRVEGETVCVPHTPGPILYGIRGEDPETVRAAAADIESEPIAAVRTFVTNQGTDAHLRDASIPAVEEARSYRVTGTVVDPPRTREGGHVFFVVAEFDTGTDPDPGTIRAVEIPDERRLRCVAFEPTKRFRDRVGNLRVGDRITVCGELGEGTLKLEKFAVWDPRTFELATPDCPDCGRSMESAGADQGYRCRDCSTTAPGKVRRPVERDLTVGWYEVPPCARRHLARPLVRGGFDAPVHPER
jgi:tRNA(Ile2)-agmatinylcytidine synthase